MFHFSIRRVPGNGGRLGVVLSVLLALSPWAQAGGQTVSLVTGNDYRPFADQGLPEGGMGTEIVRRAFAMHGIDVALAWDTWQQGYTDTLETDYEGTFPYFVSDQRCDEMHYSDRLYAVVERLFYRPSGSMRLDRLEDLNGRSVCLPVGYAMPENVGTMIRDGRVRREQPLDMERCFTLLASGAVDTVLTNAFQGWEHVDNTRGIDRGTVVTADFPVHTNSLHFIASRADRGSPERVTLFNGALAVLRTAGTYEDIVARHLGPALAAEAGGTVEYRVETADGQVRFGRPAALVNGRYTFTRRNGSTEDIPVADVVRFESVSETACRAAAPPVTPPPVTPPQTPTVTAQRPTQADLSLHGSRVIAAGLAPDLVEAFVEDEGAASWQWRDDDANGRTLVATGTPPDIPAEIEVRSAGTDAGLRSLLDGDADIWMASRPVTGGEWRRALREGLGDLRTTQAQRVVALDGVAVIVSPRNTVNALTPEQLRNIFAGRITDWAQVGGNSGRITVHARAAGSAAADSFGDIVLDGTPMTPSARRHASDADLAAAVAADPGAIGFTAVAAAGAARTVAVDACGLRQEPSSFLVKTEEYPLSRRLFMYFSPDRGSRSAAEFLAFVRTDAGQAAVEGAGFVDQRIVMQSHDDHLAFRENAVLAIPQNADVYRDLIALTRDARRLSVTFRFETGSAELDARARDDAFRLAEYLSDNGYRPDDVMLLGFADARGDYAQNLRLSRDRANEVARALAGGPGLRGIGVTRGFSEELPVACNDGEAGWQLNRRVEVWLRRP